MNNTDSQTMFRVSRSFHYIDYIVFGLFLLVSMSVGVYFSVSGGKQRTTNEYIMGNRQMRTLPTAVSLGMSFMSAITIIGQPAEMFINGFMFAFTAVSGSLGFLCSSFLLIKLLHPLQLVSPNEYLVKRFGYPRMAFLGNAFSTLSIAIYMGLCLYAPALAINLMSRGTISTGIALTISGVVGTFYTLIGGLKAVVWSDVLQSFFMISAIVAIGIRGLIDVGSVSSVISTNVNYGRFHWPDLHFDLTIRHGFWVILIGLTFDISTVAVSPAAIQRMWSFPSKQSAHVGFFIGNAVMVFIFLVCSISGFVIFAFYTNRGCDIYHAGFVGDKNDIVTYYVMERMNLPGFPGLFCASLYAGALSTLSSGLNASAATIYKDILHPYLLKNTSFDKGACILKVLVGIAGCISVGVGYMFMKVGGLVMQAGFAIGASLKGPYLGIFLLALFFPCVHPVGVFVGSISSVMLIIWINAGAIMSSSAKTTYMPYNVSNCALTNDTLSFSQLQSKNHTSVDSLHTSVLEQFYGISYLWYSAFGALFCILVALFVTLIAAVCFKSHPTPVDPKYYYDLRKVFAKCCGRKSPQQTRENYESDSPMFMEREMTLIKEDKANDVNETKNLYSLDNAISSSSK